ncbi:hypothetical protein [Moraxella phage Mcat17]|uniref:HK97-gp10 family putative phage morphogenesis protein n=1 Tax=Moraxella catarrhalis TaxID=480 RepID=UPI000722D72A|nr:HK97-gp10 family putative phage morphogenesis protein [Moraxella catarrhalis]AKI27711.1 hypothetical protein [Moraxella phage Mcat17]MPW64187.1 hypothetical protein [Moraxella catarrhalis]
MKLIGAEELGKKLKQAREEITNKQAGSALYSSLMYASLPMYKYVRSQAPMTKAPYRRYMSYGQGPGKKRAKRGTGKYEIQESGLYHKSIKRRRLTRGESANLDGAAIAIYVAEGSGKTHGSAYYWFFNEYGTKYQAARPIFRPAFDSGAEDAADRFKNKLGERIDKIMGG